MDEIADIRARAEAATPGPWRDYHNPDWGWLVVGICADVQPQDAEFIAHAREDIPYLLDAPTASEPARVARDAEIARLWKELEWVAAFAAVRSEDDSQTFARVNRGAMRTIAERARAALQAPDTAPEAVSGEEVGGC